MNQENKKFLKEFANKLKSFRTPASDRNYSRFGNRVAYPVRDNFTLEEIRKLLREGSPEQLRELSRYYYRVSGVYRNAIDLYAGMSKYSVMLTPIFDNNKAVPKNQVIDTFYKAHKFIESLHISVNFSHIMREIFLNGVYFGIMRESENGLTIQDLPVRYSRVMYKDENDLYVVEFNILFFESIHDKEYLNNLLLNYPIEIRNAFINRKKLKNPWIEIPAEMGGICFTYGDCTPPFAAAIPSIYQLDDAVDREADRDENELYKLLIQKMPIDSKGELVFQMDEVQDIHESVAEMLSDSDTVNVLTTFGDTKLESIQDSTAATQSTSRIQKYTDTAYDQMGVSELFFNCTTASGLDFAVKRIEALINEINAMFSVWIKYQINKRFAKPKYGFDFEILPIDIFNQKEVQEKYFEAAQYGYSKMYAGVAMGIPQLNQINLLTFENDILGLTERMRPLQSSYTSSGNEEDSVKNEQNVDKNDNSVSESYIDNEDSGAKTAEEEQK